MENSARIFELHRLLTSKGCKRVGRAGFNLGKANYNTSLDR